MKIEKISNKQIRCTLTREDLADRQLKLSELAYGTEKAKELFREMMQQAAYEFGFETDDLPIMIEAIPMSAESIVLIITKVDDPEELDTRFSKFAPSYEDMEDMENVEDIEDFQNTNNEDNVLELFPGQKEPQNVIPTPAVTTTAAADALFPEPLAKPESPADTTANLTRAYSFQDFKAIEQLSHVLNNVYFGKNSLYKDEKSQTYHLVLSKSAHTPQEFNKVLNIASEYGTKESFSTEKENFFREHYKIMIDGSALQILGDVL